MKLVIFSQDWADEFSPYGFAIMTESEFNVFRAYYSKPRDWYFGTNGGFDEEVLITGCTVRDITQEEVDAITKVFGLKEYSWAYKGAGLFPNKPEELLEDKD